MTDYSLSASQAFWPATESMVCLGYGFSSGIDSKYVRIYHVQGHTGSLNTIFEFFLF